MIPWINGIFIFSYYSQDFTCQNAQRQAFTRAEAIVIEQYIRFLAINQRPHEKQSADYSE